ncbi:MAG: hypothetical protein KDN22_00185 [Verrucomicrobiae bacterium]|nr:hypothetical protein [Verrucomicrobiae bacterium]
MTQRRIFFILLILLVLGGGIAAYVHWSKRFRGDTSSNAPFKVTRVELKRDFANAVLTLTVDYDNRTGDADITTAAVADDPNGARLVTTTGKAPPLFFLPGVYPPVIKAGDREQVTIIYWLDREQLQEGLNFESKGQRVPVKSALPFELDSVENQTSVIFTTPDWKQP